MRWLDGITDSSDTLVCLQSMESQRVIVIEQQQNYMCNLRYS